MGPNGVQLCQGHCPVQHVASAFPQLCEAETEVFARLLGGHVQRLATLAHGEHVCTTYVPTPAVRPASAPTSARPTARKDSDDDR
jgi:predicted ArsR family transcriptional regulator